MLRFRILGLSLFLLTPACGDAPSGEDELDTGTSDSGSGSGTTTSGSSSSDSGDASTTSATTGTTDTTTTTDDGGDFDPVPARGIAIVKVEANQGVATTIGTTDQWVPGPQRNARLVKDRDTLIRIWHQLEPGWTPRLVEARLNVTKPGGETSEYVLRKEISADSVENQLEDDFFFGLVADEGEAQPGTLYQVSLWDVTPGGESLTEQFNVNPATGSAEVGFESTEMEMNVMFIPFNYTAQGTTPDLQDPVNQQLLIDQLYMQNPVTRVNAQFHAPVPYNGNFGDVCGMLSTVNQIWQQEGSPSNVYYTGLIDTGAQSGTVGCAWLNSNINANLWRTNKSSTAETIVHEIGHDQGLSHIQCNGADSAGPDSSYPDHPLGRTLNTGFGIRNFTLFPGGSTFDYMTYCGPTWTSDWTWGRVWNRIQQFSASGDQVPLTPVLHHAIYEDGTHEYWTSEARIESERLSGLHEVEFEFDGVVIGSSPSMVDVLSDDKTIWITTPLPEGGLAAQFDLIRDITADGTREVDSSQIKFTSTM